ncbi:MULTISPECIES: hypothetical protein [Glutamicibacter]|uniref:hypothetical protein n=1 Tax=Glutamicibacter TaxID=1742989 RepID=UPI000E7E1CC2|nr:hypothetical protein [Glutamicibacter ardleyensis]HAY44131.1 hypothetical protein [Micrococcaceae bacterium]
MTRTPKFRALSLIAIFSLALASCSSGGDPTAELTAPTGATPSESLVSEEAPTLSSKDDPLDNGGYGEFTWDDFVKGKQEESGLSSWPEVERIRYVSQEVWPEEQATCLTNLGFPTTVEEGGSFSTKFTEDQEQAAAEASYTCALQYPQDLKYSQALTRTQLRTFYAYYRDALVPCLQGLNLDTGSLPSEETFVEGMASGTAPWTPYDTMDLASADTTEMNQKCPPSPSAEELYGN